MLEDIYNRLRMRAPVIATMLNYLYTAKYTGYVSVVGEHMF